MARALSARERNVVIGGAVFLVCFLSFYFVLLPKRDELGTLKARVRNMTKQYEEVQRIEKQYDRLKRETRPVEEKIRQRGKDFNLSAFVAQTESLLDFKKTREIPLRAVTYGNYEKRSSTFLYDDKTLGDIVAFLKKIENPENVIAVEDLLMTPKPSDRSRLSLRLRLATVVPVQ